MTIPPPSNTLLPPEDGQDSLPEILGGFPRHLTTQLIEEEEGHRGRREGVAGWLLGIGLALIAMTFPQERLVGEAFGEAFEHSPLWALWERLHRWVAQPIGMRAEQLRFVSAALAYGACLPAALGLARKLGCPFGFALVGSLIALLSPTAWLAGTTPGMSSAALLLALLVMRELWRSCQPSLWRLSLAWGLMVGLQASAFLLWPALLFAGLFRIEEPVARRKWIRYWIVAGLAVLALAIGSHLGNWDPVPMPSRLDLDGGLWQVDGDFWKRLLGMIPGLGVAFLGLASLWFLKRNESELPPPGWLGLWALVPVLWLLAGSALAWDASYHWLLPVALVGLFDILSRFDGGPAPGLAAGGLIIQVCVLLAGLFLIQQGDQQREWREYARQFLEEGDVVITGEPEHAYLVSHRWGQMSVVLRAADLEQPDPEFVEGVYCDELGQTNLRVKTQDFAAWAAEGLEAHGLGFRVILDRPFPDPSEGIAGLIDEELTRIVEFHTLDCREPLPATQISESP